MPSYRDVRDTFRDLDSHVQRVLSKLRNAQSQASSSARQHRKSVLTSLASSIHALPLDGSLSMGNHEIERFAIDLWQRSQTQQVAVQRDKEAIGIANVLQQMAAMSTQLAVLDKERQAGFVRTHENGALRLAERLNITSEDRVRLEKIKPWAFWSYSYRDLASARALRTYKGPKGQDFWKEYGTGLEHQQMNRDLQKDINVFLQQDIVLKKQVVEYRTLEGLTRSPELLRSQWAETVAEHTMASPMGILRQVLKTLMPDQADSMDLHMAIERSSSMMASSLGQYLKAAQKMHDNLEKPLRKVEGAVNRGAGSRTLNMDLLTLKRQVKSSLANLERMQSAVEVTIPNLDRLIDDAPTPARRACLDRAYQAPSGTANEDAPPVWFWMWFLSQDQANAATYGTALGQPMLNDHLTTHGINLDSLHTLATPVTQDFSALSTGMDSLFGVNTIVDAPSFSVPNMPTFTMPDMPVDFSVPTISMPDTTFNIPDTNFNIPDVSVSIDTGSSYTSSVDASSW